MAAALIWGNLLGLAAYAVLLFSGIAVTHGNNQLPNHTLLAFLSSMVVLLPPCMTLFYFIGTGKQLKEEIARRKLDQAYVREIGSFKRRTSGAITGSMLLYIFTYLSGGAVDSGHWFPRASAPTWHLALSLVTFVALAWSAVRQIGAIGDNVRLIIRISEDPGTR